VAASSPKKSRNGESRKLKLSDAFLFSHELFMTLEVLSKVTEFP
jgi:hypothetical protein